MAAKRPRRRGRGLRGLAGSSTEHFHAVRPHLARAYDLYAKASEAETCLKRSKWAAKAVEAAAIAEDNAVWAGARPDSGPQAGILNRAKILIESCASSAAARPSREVVAEAAARKRRRR